MGVRHKTYPIVGIQFHPESYSTDCGSKIIKNFLITHGKTHFRKTNQ